MRPFGGTGGRRAFAPGGLSVGSHGGATLLRAPGIPPAANNTAVEVSRAQGIRAAALGRLLRPVRGA